MLTVIGIGVNSFLSVIGYGTLMGMATKKNPAAVALGRLGGAKRVPKGFAKISAKRRKQISRQGVEARQKNMLSPERRREIARKAAEARWGKK